jgi:hypothetical protein
MWKRVAYVNKNAMFSQRLFTGDQLQEESLHVIKAIPSRSMGLIFLVLAIHSIATLKVCEQHRIAISNFVLSSFW